MNETYNFERWAGKVLLLILSMLLSANYSEYYDGRADKLLREFEENTPLSKGQFFTGYQIIEGKEE